MRVFKNWNQELLLILLVFSSIEGAYCKEASEKHYRLQRSTVLHVANGKNLRDVLYQFWYMFLNTPLSCFTNK